MKKCIILSLMLFGLSTMVLTAAPPDNKSDIKVLYVGGTPEFETKTGRVHTDQELEESVSARMASFESFLRDYFTGVTVVRADRYTQDMSDDFDVTVMDGLPKPIVPLFHDRQKGVYLSEGYLTEDFDRPILTIGYLSDKIGRRVGTKHDWYCLCLRSHALDWRAEHPIFNGPFEVSMTVTERPTPEPISQYYGHHFEGGRAPAQMPMWRVQKYDFDNSRDVRIGLVSRPGGYEDSPEAEYISGGHCDKSPDAVAIGRHGNYFHWGFAASPADMTDEAKPVLANAIVYISKFAGQRPIARKYNDRAPARSSVADRKAFLTREMYDSSLRSEAEWAKSMEELKAKAQQKQAGGETLDQTDQIALAFQPSPQPSYEQYLQRSAGSLFSRFGTDIAAYNNYYDENYDYFYSDGGYELIVDQDAKALAIPNNDVRILDEAIKMLENGRDADRGQRLLLRYTLNDFRTPEQWRNWYDTYKNSLFFTESGGWVFLVNSREPGINDYKSFMERRSGERIVPGETSDAEPVAVAADVAVMQDGSRVLNIKVTIHPGYHIYDNVADTDTFLPTVVDVDLPEGYSAESPLRRPFGGFYNRSGTTVYNDSVTFSQEFSGSGEGDLRCSITYQCCDTNICFPPVTKELSITLKQ